MSDFKSIHQSMTGCKIAKPADQLKLTKRALCAGLFHIWLVGQNQLPSLILYSRAEPEVTFKWRAMFLKVCPKHLLLTFSKILDENNRFRLSQNAYLHTR